VDLSLGQSLYVLHLLFKVQSLGLELTSQQVSVLHTRHSNWRLTITDITPAKVRHASVTT